MIARIPSSRICSIPIPHDERLYRKRNVVKRLLAGLKDIRRIAVRHRCPNGFLAAVSITAMTITFPRGLRVLKPEPGALLATICMVATTIRRVN